jgi:hypothetical protein
MHLLMYKIKQIRPINSYISGMSFGQKEYEVEQTKTQLNELGKLREKYMNELDRERE